jgi:tetrahydromethanopterin S-methyltransferase subunit H
MGKRITLDKQAQETLWNELRDQEEVTLNLLGHDVRFIVAPDNESDFLDMVNEIDSDPDLQDMLISSEGDIKENRLYSADEVIEYIKRTCSAK